MSPSSRLFAIALGPGLLVAAPLAHAGSCGGALGLSSENVYRGISQSEGRASAFGDVHCPFAQGWLAGIGANTFRAPLGRADSQFTLYVDRHWSLNEEWSTKLGVIHYEPLNAENRAGYQYDELSASIGWRGRWLTTLTWSPRVGNAYVGTAAGYNSWTYIESAWRQPLGSRFSLDAGLGYAHPGATPPHDYHYANLALNAAVGDIYISLSRVWTSALNFHYIQSDRPYDLTFPPKQRWVGSVVWMF